MSKAKRTIIFILAVVTCMTFCLVNGNALTDRYFFYGTSMTANFFYGSNANPSFARVTITNWGDAEEVNDLTASTYGYNDNTVDGVDNDYLLEAYARVYIYFDVFLSLSSVLFVLVSELLPHPTSDTAIIPASTNDNAFLI